MIDKTLAFIVSELNSFLRVRFPSKEEHVVMAGLSNGAAESKARTDGRLVVSLVNIEREAGAGGSAVAPRADGGFGRYQAPLHLNLYVLVSASSEKNYGQGLEFLSNTLGFFQSKPYFDAQSGPYFPQGLGRFSIELVSMTIQELNNLWAIMGASYMPSALYKVRMLTVQENWMTSAVPAVEQPVVKVGR